MFTAGTSLINVKQGSKLSQAGVSILTVHNWQAQGMRLKDVPPATTGKQVTMRDPLNKLEGPVPGTCKGELIPGAKDRKGKPVCDWDGCADPDCCGQPECKVCQVNDVLPSHAPRSEVRFD